jgi:hypothetical protein
MRRLPAGHTNSQAARHFAAAAACIVTLLASGDFVGGREPAEPKKQAVAPPKAAKPAPPAKAMPRVAIRVDVPLPIVDTIDTLVIGRIDRALRSLPEHAQRPVLVLEFRPKEGTAGEGSDFERSLSLARYFSGERLGQVQTVAYLPRTVKGHAVLSVLACEQIVMHGDAQLGAAGSDETEIDAILRRGYSEIADRRRTVPAAVALGLLDKNLAVY